MSRLSHPGLVERIKASIDKAGREIAIQGVLADLQKIDVRLGYLANPDQSNYSRLMKAHESIKSAISELIDT